MARQGLGLACAALLGLAAAAGTAQMARAEVVVTDARHRTVRLAQPAQRIVSLQPSFAEAVCALGACDRLVAVDQYTTWPESLARLPRVGSLRDANVERIAALKPDLVLVRANHRVAGQLERLGITVVSLDAQTHDGVAEELETMARLLGRPGEGTRVWARIQRGLQAQRAQVPPAWRGKSVYFEIHAGMAAAGPRSFIGETLRELGLRNIAPDGGAIYPKLSPEFVVRAAPDLLITMADLPGVGPADRPGWQQLAAMREQRHCRIPNAEFDVLVRPGPRLDEGAKAIVACLQRLAPPTAGR
jgi:iron complex transport system substrate-binding protein